MKTLMSTKLKTQPQPLWPFLDHFYWVLVVSLASLLVLGYPSFSNAQTTSAVTGQTTTENLIETDLNQFTTTGKTFIGPNGRGCSAGEFCTGGETLGGTFTTTFDLKDNMTINDINRGFTLDSGIDVKSDNSNVTVPTCVSTTQVSPDCKDIFSLTIKLFNSNQVGSNLVHTFTHEVELDFSGTQSYEFINTIPQNEFSFLTGEFRLFGIDAGFGSGAFGPAFSNPTMTTTFDIITLIETEVVDILNNTNILNSNIPQNVEVAGLTVDVSSSAGEQVTSLELEVNTEMQVEVSTEIEMEMENDINTDESVESVEVEQDSSQEGGENVSESNESEPEQTAEAEPTEQEGPKSKSSNVSNKKKSESKEKAANKIVKKMGDKGRYDSINQLKTLIVMQVLGNAKTFFNNQVILPDTQGFFSSARIPDAQIADNNAAAYFMIGGSNSKMDALTDMQYRR